MKTLRNVPTTSDVKLNGRYFNSLLRCVRITRIRDHTKLLYWICLVFGIISVEVNGFALRSNMIDGIGGRITIIHFF